MSNFNDDWVFDHSGPEIPTGGSDLEVARHIAATQGKQTGQNYDRFISGELDHAFGVRTALAGIEYGRRS